MAKKQKAKQLPFGHKLALNQWLIEQFGFDPLQAVKANKLKLRPLEGLASILRGCPEGLTNNNLHHFYKYLDT